MYGIGIYDFFSFNFIIIFEKLWKKFFTFFKKLVFLENYFTEFQKGCTNRKSAHSPVCLHNSLVSFYLTSVSAAFENVCRVNC